MTTHDRSLGVDARRFWSTVTRSGEIGPGEAGGLRRLALTDVDKEMRDLFITWCTEVGCTVAIDRVGNIFARRPGTDDQYAQLTCDVRHAEREVADRMWAEVKAAVPECARRANVEMRVAGEWQFGNEQFDPGCIRLIREAAERLSVPHRDILSQAGHDAYDISRIAPTPMIFTPCRDGISHNEAEHAELDATVPGVTEEVPVARSLRGLSLRGLDISLTPSLQFPQLPAGRGVSETFPWN